MNRAYDSRYNNVVELRPNMSMPERVNIYVANLISQGKSSFEAMDHASHYFGIKRYEVAQMVEGDPDPTAA